MPQKKDKAMAKRIAKIVSKRRVIGVGGRKRRRGNDRTRNSGRK
jgi:hypothetical protein